MKINSNAAHAVISPSGFYRTKNCPGHLWDSKDIPDRETQYSKDGTEIHEWAATALRLALKGMSPEPTLDKLTEFWKRDIASAWVDFCVDLTSRIRAVGEHVTTYVEEKVRLSELTFGTVDFALSFRKEGKDYLIIADLKTGSGHHVFARDGDGNLNDQMSLYALCLASSKGLSPDKTWMYIFQPTVHEEGYDRTVAEAHELDTKLEEVRKVEKKVLRIIEEGPQDSDYKVGKWCNSFCKAFATCKYFRRGVQSSALEELDDLTPDRPVSSAPVKKVPIEKLLTAYQMKSQIEDWLSEIEHHLMGELLRGNKKIAKHYKLVQGRAYPRWKPDTKDVAERLKKLGVKSPFRKELITITAARQAVGKEKAQKIERLLERSEPKLQIAPLSDPRAAYEDNRQQLDQLGELEDEPVRKRSGKPGRPGSKAGSAKAGDGKKVRRRKAAK